MTGKPQVSNTIILCFIPSNRLHIWKECLV